MTPELQKMVEAMASEIQRQAVADDGTLSFPTAGELKNGLIGFDGQIDLEKVARAGLEAIKDIEVPDWIDEGNAWAAPGRFLAEILKETP